MKKNFPNIRLRRLRNNSPIRNLVRENVLSPHDLIQPIFIIEGNNKTEKIKSMPDIHRMSIDIAIKEIKVLKKLGIQGIALFPCIEKKHKDIKEQSHSIKMV
jgi:porphobilinogen synthase